MNARRFAFSSALTTAFTVVALADRFPETSARKRGASMKGLAAIGARPIASSPIIAQPSAGSDGPDFDISRLRHEAGWKFTPYEATETHRLRDVLEAGKVKEDTPVLITETAAEPLAFVTDQMSFHHIAQGEAKGHPWLVTF